jgi:hypothetical protein
MPSTEFDTFNGGAVRLVQETLGKFRVVLGAKFNSLPLRLGDLPYRRPFGTLRRLQDRERRGSSILFYAYSNM